MDATKHEPQIIESTAYCRLCLKTDSIELIVQSPEEGNESLLNIISVCLGIWLTVTDDFPFGVCHSCSVSLEAIRQFRYNCQQCDLYLRNQRSAVEVPRMASAETTSDAPVEKMPCVENDYHLQPPPDGGSQQELTLEQSTMGISEANGGELNQLQVQYFEQVPEAPTEQAVPLKKFDCPECGKQLYSSRMLAQHVVREHRLCHGCRMCGMAYNSQQKLDSHAATCTGRPSRFICDQCPSAKVFSTAGSLSMHLYYAHDSLKSVVYRCEACKKNFKNRTGLKYHYNARHGCTMVECEICRRPFPTEESLYYHKQAEH
ncbi:gastrula zinc finger protein xFG20-1-like [Toxorhynchites rutilus septentrionalis]|uniref:gastrula zinc finger protein xFG20-1-like n=1 Tax=Toxorhynchites rutilus septentrionalis TaxID=329112 RepID=UPI002478D239|nr:gastrula zinc finger protein xFG20-1-like [Toxorhynchites rutilus septentrionalis]